ncbi:MAG: NADH-quinone oxidoreductase subunit C [Pseudomonadota bacterium]
MAVLHSAPRFVAAEGLLDTLVADLGNMVLAARAEYGEIIITVVRDRIEDALRLLRDGHDYQQLMEIAGADYPSRAERFEVVYMLLSVTRNHRLMVKVCAAENTPVPTVTTLWPVAGWLEREVYDMYGVTFAGNLDLRRILTDYGFEGHPFRKDFPLTGYVELRYSEEDKRVVYEPVKLAQDLRTFDFMSPWEGADYVLPGDEKAAAPPPAPAPVATAPETRGAPTVKDEKYVMAAGKPGTADNTSGGADPKVAPSSDATSNVAGQGQAQPIPKQVNVAEPGAPEPTEARPARNPRSDTDGSEGGQGPAPEGS